MPVRKESALEKTRRYLADAMVLLCLVACLGCPYIHLALEPHRYCLVHRKFEKATSDHRHEPGQEKVPSQEKDDPHEECPVCALLSTLTVSFDPCFSLDPHAVVLKRVVSREPDHRLRATDRLAMAPKQSPPC